MYGIEVKQGKFRATKTVSGKTSTVGTWRGTYSEAARDIESVGGTRPDPLGAIERLKAMVAARMAR